MEYGNLGNYLIIGVIMAVVVYGVASPIFEAQSQTDTLTLLNATNVSTTYAFIALSETVTCNTTALVRTTEYIPYAAAGNIFLTNNTWNNTACAVAYNYYDTYYNSSGLLRTIISFLTVIFVVALLKLAGRAE